jgi:DNA-binding phage protein
MVLMMKENIASNLTIEGMEDFDPVKYLTDEEAIDAYLTDVHQANNPMLLKLAMHNIEQARLINSSKK